MCRSAEVTKLHGGTREPRSTGAATASVRFVLFVALIEHLHRCLHAHRHGHLLPCTRSLLHRSWLIVRNGRRRSRGHGPQRAAVAITMYSAPQLSRFGGVGLILQRPRLAPLPPPKHSPSETVVRLGRARRRRIRWNVRWDVVGAEPFESHLVGPLTAQ